MATLSGKNGTAPKKNETLSGKDATTLTDPNRYQFSFDEVLFEAIVECVVVHSKQYITFELKCGLRLTEYFADPVLSVENKTLPPDSLSVYTSRLLTDPRITSPYDNHPAPGCLCDESEIEGSFSLSAEAADRAEPTERAERSELSERSERSAFPQQGEPLNSDHKPQNSSQDQQSKTTDPRSLPYGYRWNKGSVEIVPEEAERLRTFFHLLSEGVTVPDAGIAAGIPGKLSTLRKLASRRAYGGTNKFPPIIAPSLLNIKTSDNRRAPFVPMYTEFEYGVVPEMGGGASADLRDDMTPAECISALYQEIRPVEVYQKGVAEFPRKEMPAQSSPALIAQSFPASSAMPTPSTASTPSAMSAPLTSIAPGTATMPTLPASNVPETTATPTAEADATSFLPSDITSGKRRIVDLAIDAHNEKAKTVAPGGPSIATTVATTHSLPLKLPVIKTEIEGGDGPVASHADTVFPDIPVMVTTR